MAGCIVCGVDESDEARRAARVAARLSAGLGLPLVLVHVAPPRLVAPDIPLDPRDLPEEERASSLRLLESVTDGLPSRAHGRVDVGRPADRLAAIAGEEGAEMVVVGSRSRGGMKGAVLGSVSTDLATKAPCPVVVVPPRSNGA